VFEWFLPMVKYHICGMRSESIVLPVCGLLKCMNRRCVGLSSCAVYKAATAEIVLGRQLGQVGLVIVFRILR
jgi:hypothetical protein